MTDGNSFSLSDPLARTVVRITMNQGEHPLTKATGFFLTVIDNGVPTPLLLTNWHVLTGRNPLQPGLISHPPGGTPDNMIFEVPLRRGEVTNVYSRQKITAQLYLDDGLPSWFQHPAGRHVDIAALKLPPSLLNDYDILGIEDVANTFDMAVQVGSGVFIVGYPLGFSHFANLPVWKSGNIASEPHLREEADVSDRVLIDATTREGMSGSPVIMRANTHYVREQGSVVCLPGAMRWLGMYSGRPVINADGSSDTAGGSFVEVAYFIRNGTIHHMILNQRPGFRKGEVPD